MVMNVKKGIVKQVSKSKKFVERVGMRWDLMMMSGLCRCRD